MEVQRGRKDNSDSPLEVLLPHPDVPAVKTLTEYEGSEWAPPIRRSFHTCDG